MASVILASDYYGEYHGHRRQHLETILSEWRRRDDDRKVIWLVGDSTLDNKVWLRKTRNPPGIYASILSPARSFLDVCYWMNEKLDACGLSEKVCCINCAVEASMLRQRVYGNNLLKWPQDALVRESMKENDVLVCSIGGNDIALSPTIKTAFAALTLAKFTSVERIKSGKGWAFAHLCSIFGQKTQEYIEQLIMMKKKPKRVIVCMLYFLDETNCASWAGTVLHLLGYNKNPSHVQTIISSLFQHATKQIRIEGVELVHPLALFDVLDGKTHEDYVARVEPSEKGGEKIANLILKYCVEGTKT